MRGSKAREPEGRRERRGGGGRAYTRARWTPASAAPTPAPAGSSCRSVAPLGCSGRWGSAVRTGEVAARGSGDTEASASCPEPCERPRSSSPAAALAVREERRNFGPALGAVGSLVFLFRNGVRGLGFGLCAEFLDMILFKVVSGTLIFRKLWMLCCEFPGL